MFRPEVFFDGPTEGFGILRDALGRDRSRFSLRTVGAMRRDRQEMEIRATFVFDTGEVDPWRWVMRDSGAGVYLVAEAKAGAGIVGKHRGAEYVLRFRRPVGALRGLAAPRFVSRLTCIGEASALKTVRISLLGAPVASLIAVLNRLDR